MNTVSMEPLLAFYMFASFIKYPVFQALLYEKSCISRYKVQDETYCQNISLVHDNVALQRDANHLYLLSSLCLMLPSIPLSLILGSLSDVWDAKIPVMVPLFGFIVGDLNYVLQCVFFKADPRWLLLSDLASGFTGGYSALFGYQKMAFLEGAIGTGATLGFLLAGIIREFLNFYGTFLLIMGLRILCIMYVIVFVKNLDLKSGGLASNRTYMKLILKLEISKLFIITECQISGVLDIQYSFFRFKLEWGDKEFGWYSGIVYGLSTAAVLIPYPWLKTLGVYDLSLCALGLAAKIISLIATAFVFSNWFAFAISPLSSFNRFISTALRTTVSQAVEFSEQGRIFSVISVADGLVSLSGSLVFNSIYPLTLPKYPYFCFVFIAGLLVIPLISSLYLLHKDQLAETNSCSDIGSSSNESSVSTYLIKLLCIARSEELEGS
ncbi:unnamed protein product [Enterobius vermicularis]|uniref:Proton-coupled folate transporter n=1 Tax=Enterobius vermicularis TaxID=51028 RepID=A0A0N4V7G4_ENTVE|nr:unnamed protein product [Enterobius vermicularis]